VGRLSEFLQNQGFDPEQAPEERAGFAEPPTDKWLLVQTARDGAWGAPEVRLTASGLPLFSCTFRVLGAEKGTDRDAAGSFTRRFTWFLEPYQGEGAAGSPLQGPFVALLNALFSSGVGDGIEDGKERAKARWRNTLTVLEQIAERHGVDPAQYASPAQLFGALAALALREQPRTLLMKYRMVSRTRKNADGSREAVTDDSGRAILDPRIQQIKDDTTANREKLGIEVWIEPDEEIPF